MLAPSWRLFVGYVPAPRPATVAAKPEPEPEPEFEDVDDDQELVLEDLTRDQVLDWRARAATDHQVVLDHIERYGEHSAQRLFTRVLVATVQRLSGLEHLDLGYTPWGRHEWLATSAWPSRVAPEAAAAAGGVSSVVERTH
ncbi:hypothetical protein [Streptomyces sp. NPDC004296]|uniref:hypothetical protein n=1 Tax=Streptomyces sp. NPDC004296 TaxID=3364697 RepID=UPI0036C0F954